MPVKALTLPYRLLLVVSAFLHVAPSPAAADALTQRQAHSIALDAYVYLYPLVTMDVTRRQMSNVKPGQGIGGPPNSFVNMQAYPTADDKVVVRPNFDTLYSSAWLDLTGGPIVLTIPDTDGRFYLMPMMDMWTDVFASPGWRTTGTQKQTFLVVPPGWQLKSHNEVIEDFGLPEQTQILAAPTPIVWIIGRIKTDGPSDYPAVHSIQKALEIRLLSERDRLVTHPQFEPDPSVDMTTPPKRLVDDMSATEFFGYAAELLKVHPPHPTDQPIIAQMRTIGLIPGQGFDINRATPEVRDEMSSIPAEAQRLMAWKLPTLARVANGWSMNTDTMGVYGNYYLKRAIVAQVGLGANLPEDAIYPLNLVDSTQAPLNGRCSYTMHLDKDAMPPADAFWSVTLYDQDGFQVENHLNRFALSSWMSFDYNADGSLDLYFQAEGLPSPRDRNWLPTPNGPFNLTMRIYAPRMDALTGKWNPPEVVNNRCAH
jgi:hypothetical protein